MEMENTKKVVGDVEEINELHADDTIATQLELARAPVPAAVMTTTVALGSFLLFSIQPMIAKFILPWFGGSAVVWTTSIMFFQVTMIGGYGYAHWLSSKQGKKEFGWLHIAALAFGVATLPIMPSEMWKPTGDENPVVQITMLLAATIGTTYLLLTATSPLIQSWFARVHAGKSPYKLFAVSNLASMTALLAYPAVIEPLTTRKEQAIGWSIGFCIYATLCGYTCWRMGRAKAVEHPPRACAGVQVVASPKWCDMLRWTLIAALGSAMMLATSNHLTQNIPSIPMMWVLPLSVYLLTFVLCFDERGWYRPGVMIGEVALMLGAMSMLLAYKEWQFTILWHMVVFLVGLFVACMFLHGELARRKPAAKNLTWFYMSLSVGGAVGGIAVGVIAPLTLPGFLELEICIVGISLAAVLLTWKNLKGRRAVVVTVAVFSCGLTVFSVNRFGNDAVMTSRNFYGSLKVIKVMDENGNKKRQLVHGAIVHGEQNEAEEKRREPTAYFTRQSGIGEVLGRSGFGGRKVGVIGLGAGTLAAYGKKGDRFRFYEIDPGVVRAAQNDFSFLKDSDAQIEVVVGDGRLAIESELTSKSDAGLDVIAVDAFSGDSIPLHLMTSEAVDAYLARLKPDGIIAFHVSNKFINLVPVLRKTALQKKLKMKHVHEKNDEGRTLSEWVVFCKGADITEWGEGESSIKTESKRVWTDDFSNIGAALRL
jgi:hypothetical protein